MAVSIERFLMTNFAANLMLLVVSTRAVGRVLPGRVQREQPELQPGGGPACLPLQRAWRRTWNRTWNRTPGRRREVS